MTGQLNIAVQYFGIISIHVVCFSSFRINMLQSMVFRNVGLFKDTNVIQFRNDTWHGCLGVLVGINGSGKSMANECIRRCLHSDMSHSKSTIPDPTTPSYILCKFELDPILVKNLLDLADNDIICDISKNVCLDTQITCATGVFVKDSESKFLELSVAENRCNLLLIRKENASNICYYYKGNSNRQNIINSIIENENIRNDQNKAECDQNLLESLELCLKTNATNTGITEYEFNMIYNQLFGLEYGSVTFVYPMRGIGAAMGSHADQMKRDHFSANYENAVQNAKMMIKYWKLMKNCADIEVRYNRIINTLIPNCRYTLSIIKDKEKEILIMEDLDNPTTGNVHILKTPDGIFEALLFSLCLATRKQSYITICYDEPSRCMHEQLVDNMYCYITELVKKHKVCLVIPTHSPCFITEETWKNITYFQRRCSVLKCQTLQNDLFSINQLRFFSQEHIKTLMFAKKILMVEGETDKIFVQKLLAYLKCGTHLSKFSAEQQNQIINNCVRYGNIKVVYVNGKRNMEKVSKLCHSLQISCKALNDRDKIDNKKDMKTGLEHSLGPGEISGIRYIAENSKGRQCLEEVTHALAAFVNSLWTKDNLPWTDDENEFTALSGKIDALRKNLNKISKYKEQHNGILQEDQVRIIKEYTDTSTDLRMISKQQVQTLMRLHSEISLSWAGCKPQKDTEFCWTSNALEEVLSKCAQDAGKPLFGRNVTKIMNKVKTQHTQFIWYLDKDSEASGHMKSFTCEEIGKLVEFVLDNASEEIIEFVMFLTKYAGELNRN